MDYTTVADCKNGPTRIKSATDDAFLSKLITQVSRDIDRYVTETPDISSNNYFLLEDVADEQLMGNIDYQQKLLFYPHKPLVESVSAVAYRVTPNDTWIVLDPTLCLVAGIEVSVWLKQVTFSKIAPAKLPTKVQVKVSYRGGFATTTAGLPEDLTQCATQLVVRAYHEYEGGLSDAVGTAETGMFVYNKQLPVTVKRKLELYCRPVGWRHMG